MRKKNGKKNAKKLWMPIVLGFAVLYLVIMGLATWLMGLKFAEEFRDNLFRALSSMQQWIESNEQEEGRFETYTQEMREGYYTYLTAVDLPAVSDGQFQRFSAGIYGTDGKLLSKTGDVIGNTAASEETGYRTAYQYDSLDFLDGSAKEDLAVYVREYYERVSDEPPKYRILLRENKNTKEPWGIYVQEVLWKAGSGQDGRPYVDSYTDSSYSYSTGTEVYRQVGSEIVWEWERPGIEEAGISECREVYLHFPYLIYGGYDRWKQWSENVFLQGFSEQIEIDEETMGGSLWSRYVELFEEKKLIQTEESLRAPVYPGDGEGPICYVEVRAENHPWFAALDYLKYVYLFGFVLMLACMAVIIHVTRKTCEQQAALEEMRRDFTNAMAHELKTPLGIIRGFAENLQEHNMEEKRDYYLEQIVGQTEEMDKLVAQMIALSRMDSENLKLKKETLSMKELMQEQLGRFAPMLEEKHLRVEYDCSTDFCVEGDREYLSKAVWNLLSNAICYNLPDGCIRIRTEDSGCSIENTGFPMSEEELAHAGDMFYRGDVSLGSGEKHMGLGLYLTGKILELHRLRFSIENVPDGVRVTVKR